MEKHTLGTRNVSIEFPGVKALTDVSFEVSTGEIRAVVGANGAGKSTLMKILAGANPDYTGDVYMDDQIIELKSTMAAKKHGIQIVFQEVDTALVPTLSVAENVMLNNMVMDTRNPLVGWGNIRRQAREILERLHIEVNVRRLVQNLTLAQKQMVLIAKAIASQCNFLILDEPTAPLSDTETAELFRLVRHLQATENIAIIFISHRINEVLQICEKYTVMRNGEIVDTTPITPQTTSREIVEKMLGRSFDEVFTKDKVDIGDTMFEVSHLSGADGKVNDVSLHVRKGEIVGI
ncbi:MAG TPA: ATP-binding cassette domain-containing protein, partial [Candidatus Limiplasma sp.]|nr:ATP-binding cassette domain-containing protein [Candidatus Limiplasma sp.]